MTMGERSTSSSTGDTTASVDFVELERPDDDFDVVISDTLRSGGSYHNDPDALRDNISGQMKMEGDNIILDPLLKYLVPPKSNSLEAHSSSPLFNVDDAINALKCEGYYHIPSVLTPEECNEAIGVLWDFVEDVSGGCVVRNDPLSWYPPHELCIVDEDGRVESREVEDINHDETRDAANRNGCHDNVVLRPIICTDPNEHDDLDPWPHTGYHSFPDMFQSLGAGYVLGDVRQHLAQRVFEPLFGTRELLSSKEGFTFSRPLMVNGKNENNHNLQQQQQQQQGQSPKDIKCKRVMWTPHHLDSIVRDSMSNVGHGQSDDVHKKRPLYQVCSKPQPISEGQHFDQGVPMSVVRRMKGDQLNPDEASNKVSKKQLNRNRKQLERHKKLKDLAGLCHIQASISFTDQTLDRHRGGGHFLCYPHSHSEVHWNLVGGTYRATSSENERSDDPTWVPLTDQEIQQLADMGCPERRIYANVGDVILWRSDLVHAGVAPSLQIVRRETESGKVKYSGPESFRAVGYCSMLPTQAVKDYMMYSLEKQKVMQSRGVASNNSLPPAAQLMIETMENTLFQQKLESYKTGRTGDHRPGQEHWHQHRRITMWNNPESLHCSDSEQSQCKLIPPRLLQRPRFRLGKPALNVRLAELYGLIPYRQPEETRLNDLERAVIRGVRFIEGVYRGRRINGEETGSWKMRDGKYCTDVGVSAESTPPIDIIPICLATLDMLKPRVDDCASGLLTGQDKYLGGVASPCGRYIYGVSVSTIWELRAI